MGPSRNAAARARAPSRARDRARPDPLACAAIHHAYRTDVARAVSRGIVVRAGTRPPFRHDDVCCEDDRRTGPHARRRAAARARRREVPAHRREHRIDAARRARSVPLARAGRRGNCRHVPEELRLDPFRRRHRSRPELRTPTTTSARRASVRRSTATATCATNIPMPTSAPRRSTSLHKRCGRCANAFR